MKKELAVFLFFAGCLPALILPVSASETHNFACSAPYDLSNKLTSTVSKVSGANFFSEKLAERILKSQVTKNANGKFTVGVDSFSVADLKNGRFKGLHIHGENIVADGVYFSTMDIDTLCDFNYIVYDKKISAAVFKEDFPLSFSVTLSETDLNNTMSASGYYELIEKINNFGRTIALFEISSTKAKIKDNKFIYVFNVKIPFINSGDSNFSVALITDLNVVDGKIQLNNPQIINQYIKADLSRLTKAFNYLNPLEYSLDVLENKNADLKVKNVMIVNNKISITGTINVSKDVLTQDKE